LDTVAGAKAVGQLQRFVDTLRASDLESRRTRWLSQAVIQFWRAAHGDYSGLDRTAAEGKPLLGSPKAPGYAQDHALLVDMLEAIAESRRKGEVAALTRLDSAIARGQTNSSFARAMATLATARLWEEKGDLAAARRALRRVPIDYSNPSEGRAIIAREEGRIAALLGDRQAAIAAYQRYLRFRANAEPELVPERERIKTELQRLTDGR